MKSKMAEEFMIQNTQQDQFNHGNFYAMDALKVGDIAEQDARDRAIKVFREFISSDENYSVEDAVKWFTNRYDNEQ